MYYTQVSIYLVLYWLLELFVGASKSIPRMLKLGSQGKG